MMPLLNVRPRVRARQCCGHNRAAEAIPNLGFSQVQHFRRLTKERRNHRNLRRNSHLRPNAEEAGLERSLDWRCLLSVLLRALRPVGNGKSFDSDPLGALQPGGFGAPHTSRGKLLFDHLAMHRLTRGRASLHSNCHSKVPSGGDVSTRTRPVSRLAISVSPLITVRIRVSAKGPLNHTLRLAMSKVAFSPRRFHPGMSGRHRPMPQA